MKTAIWIPCLSRGQTKEGGDIKSKHSWKIAQKSLLDIAVLKANGLDLDIHIDTNDPNVIGFPYRVGKKFIAKAHKRHYTLCTPDSPVFHAFVAAQEYLYEYDQVILWQVVNPFVDHLKIPSSVGGANSVMLAARVPHNWHWLNQRKACLDTIEWQFPTLRTGSNKQAKPPAYAFGGAVLFDRQKALDAGTFFVPRCDFVEVDWVSAFDVDNHQDLEVAKCLTNLPSLTGFQY